MKPECISAHTERACARTEPRPYVHGGDDHATSRRNGNIVEGEQVHVLDITNGARLVTYAMEGPPASGVIGMNGATAHLIIPRDLVIVMSDVVVDDSRDLDTLRTSFTSTRPTGSSPWDQILHNLFGDRSIKWRANETWALQGRCPWPAITTLFEVLSID